MEPRPYKYIQGLFSTPAIHDDESFKGYLLRLASANFMSGINGIIKVLSEKLGRRLKSSQEIVYDNEALEVLGSMSMGYPQALQSFAARHVIDGAMLADGIRVDEDALMERYSQVCSCCLREHGYAKKAWDYATVVCCAQHGKLLIDNCPECQCRILWSRHDIMHCGECGFDLRFAAQTNASAPVIETSQDFEALAPFRVRLGDRHHENVSWDTAFRFVKAIALDTAHWCSNNYPERNYFCEMYLESRHAVISCFARTKKRHSYHIQLLGKGIRSKLAHLSQIKAEDVIGRYATQFLIEQAALIHPYSTTMLYGLNQPERQLAAHLFSGKPPVLRNREDVSHFLGCDDSTVQCLFSEGMLSEKLDYWMGFDIDEVVNALNFLEEDLIGLNELRHLVGVPIDWEVFNRNPVIPRWNSYSPSDSRVSVASAIDVQNRLKLTIGAMPLPSSPISLKLLATRCDSPCLPVLAGVKLLLSGGISSASWVGDSFSWADIQIDEAYADLVLNGF